jgi:transcriptional regulator with XRE-family HTH domain
MAAVAPSPLHEGRTLRRARQRKHVTISEAAEATRISSRFLEALEREASLDEFPAPVYARAFLREYAAYLGLDSEKLVTAFDSRHEAQAEPQLVPAPAVPPPRRWPARAAAVISVLALVTLAVLELASSGGGRGPGPSPSGRLGSLPVIGTANPTESHAPIEPKRIHVVMVVHGDCWIHATADGRLVFSDRTFHDGERVAFTAKRGSQLILGAPGQARVLVNGKRVRTGPPSQVAKLKLAMKDGKVRVLRQ